MVLRKLLTRQLQLSHVSSSFGKRSRKDAPRNARISPAPGKVQPSACSLRLLLCGLALHPHTVYVLGGISVGVGAPSLLLETSDSNHTEFASLTKEGATEDLKCCA